MESIEYETDCICDTNSVILVVIGLLRNNDAM